MVYTLIARHTHFFHLDSLVQLCPEPCHFIENSNNDSLNWIECLLAAVILFNCLFNLLVHQQPTKHAIYLYIGGAVPCRLWVAELRNAGA